MGIRRLFATAAAVAALSAIGAAAHATAVGFGYVDVRETDAGGYVGVIPGSDPALTVGSDGENPFDPFGAGVDTSDGIVLNSSWAPDPSASGAFGANGWVRLGDSFTWVLPACNSTGCENANISEPVGKWYFTPGGIWTTEAGDHGLRIFEQDGTLSDVITLANDGPGGTATITFNSGNFGVPEPATWAMMLVGFGALGGVLRTQRKTVLA